MSEASPFSLSRMNMFCITSGTSSAEMLSHGVKGIMKETTSGHVSTRSESSAARLCGMSSSPYNGTEGRKLVHPPL